MVLEHPCSYYASLFEMADPIGYTTLPEVPAGTSGGSTEEPPDGVIPEQRVPEYCLCSIHAVENSSPAIARSIEVAALRP